jgi:caffeoyl-CoA O-methyltransferase
MELKYLTLNDALYRYACAQRSDAQDPVLAALRKENQSYGEDSKCQISEEQGAFLTLLVAAIGARSALEVGTFTGYSSICIARGLLPGGRLRCIDQNATWAGVAQRFWAKAGVQDKIHLQIGEAIPLLRQLEPELVLDFAFIDAAKHEYDTYFELILPKVRPNGLIVLDNMLWAGRLTGNLDNDPNGRAIDDLNRKLAQDPRVQAVLLPIADGIQVCRKLAS